MGQVIKGDGRKIVEFERCQVLGVPWALLRQSTDGPRCREQAPAMGDARREQSLASIVSRHGRGHVIQRHGTTSCNGRTSNHGSLVIIGPLVVSVDERSRTVGWREMES